MIDLCAQVNLTHLIPSAQMPPRLSTPSVGIQITREPTEYTTIKNTFIAQFAVKKKKRKITQNIEQGYWYTGLQKRSGDDHRLKTPAQS